MSAQHTPGPVPSLRGRDPADMTAVELQSLVYALRDQRDELLEALIALSGEEGGDMQDVMRARAAITKATGSAQ